MAWFARLSLSAHPAYLDLWFDHDEFRRNVLNDYVRFIWITIKMGHMFRANSSKISLLHLVHISLCLMNRLMRRDAVTMNLSFTRYLFRLQKWLEAAAREGTWVHVSAEITIVSGGAYPALAPRGSSPLPLSNSISLSRSGARGFQDPAKLFASQQKRERAEREGAERSSGAGQRWQGHAQSSLSRGEVLFFHLLCFLFPSGPTRVLAQFEFLLAFPCFLNLKVLRVNCWGLPRVLLGSSLLSSPMEGVPPWKLGSKGKLISLCASLVSPYVSGPISLPVATLSLMNVNTLRSASLSQRGESGLCAGSFLVTVVWERRRWRRWWKKSQSSSFILSCFRNRKVSHEVTWGLGYQYVGV